MKKMVLLAILCFSLTGCAMLSGLYGDLKGMTPADYAENVAIVRPVTKNIPFPFGEAATFIGTWVVFLGRNKYKDWMRKKALAAK